MGIDKYTSYVILKLSFQTHRRITNMEISTFDSVGFCGYEQKTTFWMDFSIADNFGVEAIKDTYKRAFDAWKDDVVYVTELVMVLNWKCWQYASTKPTYCKLYSDLFYEAQGWCYDNLEGDDLTYFYRTTD